MSKIENPKKLLGKNLNILIINPLKQLKEHPYNKSPQTT